MIYGERVRLRAVEREDLPHFVRWLNDPEVQRGLTLYRPLSLAEEEQWFENLAQQPRDERPLAIEIREGEEWRLVGNSSLMHIDWRNRSAEVGLFIGEKRYWDRGYGSEVLRLWLRYAFETLNLNRVYLHVHANNRRAVHVYEKVGFVLEGRLRQAVYQDGEYHDVLVMSVLRSEWKSEGG
ncbi:MAG: N-acetyltransferase [Anaerolineae bacterium]|nr:MAG: N-acetyltransferase [Anaerolineae bacterium]